MPTVTGYTAERMKEIEDATIIGAHLLNGHLILEKFDDSETDAGSITGYPIEMDEIVTPATPAADKIFVYAKSGGRLYVKDDTGVELQLGRSSDVQVFTPGDYTWTKPVLAKRVRVHVFGAGSGGGGGRRGAAGTARFGGGGGAGGAYTTLDIDAGDLTATVSVHVAAGGAAGARATGDSTNGSNGGIGGASWFGTSQADSYASTFASLSAGIGGTNAVGTGGVANPVGGLLIGSDGGSSSATVDATVGAYAQGSAGGGGGGGIDTSNGGKLPGKGGIWQGRVGMLAAPAGTAGSTPASNSTPGNGGGGGNSNPSGNAVNGGNGATPGGGGGGGGACVNGFNSGNGGAGGAGLVVVITTF